MREPDDALRLSILQAWKSKCAWCRKPLSYNLMEIDHIIPKSSSGKKLANLIKYYGLPKLFDVFSTKNLVPSCRPCNGEKGDRPLPRAVGLLRHLDRAAKRAGAIEAAADKFRLSRDFETHLAKLRAIDNLPVDERIAKLRDQQKWADEEIERITGKAAKVRIHSLLHEPIAPDVRKAKRLLRKHRLMELLEDWLKRDRDAKDVLKDCFDSDDQALIDVWPRKVERLVYSDDAKAFLARVQFHIEYNYRSTDDVVGPADTTDSFDIWFVTDEDVTEIIDSYPDRLGTLPN